MTKKVKMWLALVALTTMLLTLLLVGQGVAQVGLTPIEELGEFLYFDQNLSEPNGQACADCHLPSAGFVDPDSDLPVSAGVLPHRFGDRNSPASAYAMYAPSFHWDDDEELFIGGQFWDGRATGEVLGDPLADQALGPFLNPVEMANPKMKTVINSVKQSDYADLFEEVWPDISFKDTEAAYDAVALSIAAFERTADFGEFSSAYDEYLQACLEDYDKDDCARGLAGGQDDWTDFFTAQEWLGFQLFMNETEGEGARCVLCHVADWPEDPGNVVVPNWAPDGFVPPVFTDFSYDNLGVPKNWDNPFLYMPPNLNPDGADFVDHGLARFLVDRPDLWPDPAPVGWDVAGEDGKFKVMTLRNIGLTAPYAHNGFFMGPDALKTITHFYNTRDLLDDCADVTSPDVGVNCWPAPEVPATINVDELGDLGLSDADEDALVAFMMMLSDQ